MKVHVQTAIQCPDKDNQEIEFKCSSFHSSDSTVEENNFCTAK